MSYVTVQTHDSILRARRMILGNLSAEMAYRRLHEDWEDRERDAIVDAANRYADRYGLLKVTVDQVRRIETLAVGHIDYASKLALYVAEMVHGLRPVA